VRARDWAYLEVAVIVMAVAARLVGLQEMGVLRVKGSVEDDAREAG
jgi:hypothetical protein